MATITLYKDKVNGVGSLLDDIIKSSNNLSVQLGTLKNTLQGVDSSTCNLQDTVDSISSSSKSEDEKVEDLKTLNSKLTDFIEMTSKRDSSAKNEINKAKEEFYTKYSYLKPECEKSVWEHIKDGIKSACEWCAKHWKLLATIVIVAVAVVLLVSGVGSGLGATIIAGACWGAISGAVIGGVAGGLESMANGGSFFEGFENGAFSGAVSGAISGAAFAGIGQLGAVLGKGIKCTSALGKFVKGTAAVTKVMNNVMDGFDTLATLDSLIGSGHIAELNAKLHSSKAYNIFQTGVGVVSTLTGGMTTTMKCFVAGTLVLTAKGLAAIESIKAGDMVYTAHEKTLEFGIKPVVETYIRETDTLIHITVNGEEIISTVDHPYYVKGKGFMSAELLWIGAELMDNNGNTLIVEQIFRETLDNETVKVYNFKVEDYHTYFVGNNCVLVHNSECVLEFKSNKESKNGEFKTQLEDQEKGLGDLTIDEYQKNRKAYEDRKAKTGNGRDPQSAKFQRQERNTEIKAEQARIMAEAKQNGKNISPKDALKQAKEWASDKNALHGPDQVAGGYANRFNGLGDAGVNKSIGSQWVNNGNVSKLDTYVADQLAKGGKISGSTKLSELNIKFKFIPSDK